jgi:hypothetical protein
MRLRKQVQLGALFIAAVVGFAVVAFALGRMKMGPPQAQLQGIFDEVGQLKVGNNVVYRGVHVGKVTGISFARGGGGVLVTMAVPTGMNIPVDAAVQSEPESVMGPWQAQIISQSWYPDAEYTRTRTKGVLPGTTLPDIAKLTAAASAMAGNVQTMSANVQATFTEKAAAKIRQQVADAEKTSDDLNRALSVRTRAAGGMTNGVLATSVRIRAMSDSMKLTALGMRAALASGSTRQLVTTARQASARMVALTEGIRARAASFPTPAGYEARLAAIQTRAESAGRSVESMGPRVDSAGAMLQRARTAMVSLEQALQKMDSGPAGANGMLSDPSQYENALRAAITLRQTLDDIQAHPEKYLGKKLF